MSRAFDTEHFCQVTCSLFTCVDLSDSKYMSFSRLSWWTNPVCLMEKNSFGCLMSSCLFTLILPCMFLVCYYTTYCTALRPTTPVEPFWLINSSSYHVINYVTLLIIIFWGHRGHTVLFVGWTCTSSVELRLLKTTENNHLMEQRYFYDYIRTENDTRSNPWVDRNSQELIWDKAEDFQNRCLWLCIEETSVNRW